MWNRVEVNCKNFECPNNGKGNCRLNKIALTPDGSGVAGHLICDESTEVEPKPWERPETGPDSCPDPTEGLSAKKVL